MKRAFFASFALMAALCFTALGIWQIERRAWKLDLIERVDARIHAAPVPIPVAADWPRFDAKSKEYTRVSTQGVFLNKQETLVQALTARGAGFWVLTPLQTSQGTVLVNRGFVPPDHKGPVTRKAAQFEGTVTITGLIRASEPGGGFLRGNDPVSNRWYSRDIDAIARAKGLGDVAPFFIDADSTPNPGGFPLGGLTIVQFRNSHLVYALTWFGLALLSLAGLWFIFRSPDGR